MRQARKAAASDTAGKTMRSASLPDFLLLSSFFNSFSDFFSSGDGSSRSSLSSFELSSSSSSSSSLESDESSSSSGGRLGCRGGPFLSSFLSSFFLSFLLLSWSSLSESSPSSSPGLPELLPLRTFVFAPVVVVTEVVITLGPGCRPLSLSRSSGEGVTLAGSLGGEDFGQ